MFLTSPLCLVDIHQQNVRVILLASCHVAKCCNCRSYLEVPYVGGLPSESPIKRSREAKSLKLQPTSPSVKDEEARYQIAHIPSLELYSVPLKYLLAALAHQKTSTFQPSLPKPPSVRTESSFHNTGLASH